MVRKHKGQSMSEQSSDDVNKFYFSFEQVVNKRQTGVYRVIKQSLWEPPTDVHETDDVLYVRVEVAGMRESKFQISLLDDMLVISGIRSRPDHTGAAFHQMEIPYGDFRTAVNLPYKVDAEQAKARYKDGFLDIELPRAE